MTLKEYELAALRTAGSFGSRDYQLMYSALAVAGEAGEYADLVKKLIFHQKELDYDTMALELGDVLWGLAFAARELGYTLEDIAQMNLDKLAKRYPEGYIPGGGNR